MTVLLTGASGQLGEAVQRLAAAASVPVLPMTRDRLDLARPETVGSLMRAAQPTAIVSAGAYTAVDRAEQDSRTAWAVNADAPAAMAKVARDLGIPLIHVSTDYVFDGQGDRPWQEHDPRGPLGVYGASKAAGEMAVLELCPSAVILRTSWVVSHHGHNFIKTMLKLVDRESLNIVDDQHGRPTHADLLAAVILDLLSPARSQARPAGLFHVSNDGPATTWFGLAARVFARAADHGHAVPSLNPIPTEQYPTPARRPGNSMLDLARIRATVPTAFEDWRPAVDRIVDRILEQRNA